MSDPVDLTPVRLGTKTWLEHSKVPGIQLLLASHLTYDLKLWPWNYSRLKLHKYQISQLLKHSKRGIPETLYSKKE